MAGDRRPRQCPRRRRLPHRFQPDAGAGVLPAADALSPRLLRRWLPARIDAADPAGPLYLDPAAREMPVVALGAAAREALRMADALESMLQGLRDAVREGDRRQISETKRLDDVLDKLNTAIKAYLTSLDPEAMSDADHRRVTEILTFATNMEHAGDIVDKNLLGLARRS